MRLDDLFKNLGYLAGSVATHIRDASVRGVPLDELDVTGPPPHAVAVAGPGCVAIRAGEVFRIDVDGEPDGDAVRFALTDERLSISGGDSSTTVRISMPAPKSLAVAGSGQLTCDAIAIDGDVSVAGSGRLEVAAVEGGALRVDIAGSGRVTLDGKADTLALSIAGSGSCDGEGLLVDQATVNVAGSGDAIFACNGEVSASLMGSGNVIVRGSARCSVKAVGSGALVCERDAAHA